MYMSVLGARLNPMLKGWSWEQIWEGEIWWTGKSEGLKYVRQRFGRLFVYWNWKKQQPDRGGLAWGKENESGLGKEACTPQMIPDIHWGALRFRSRRECRLLSSSLCCHTGNHCQFHPPHRIPQRRGQACLVPSATSWILVLKINPKVRVVEVVREISSSNGVVSLRLYLVNFECIQEWRLCSLSCSARISCSSFLTCCLLSCLWT